MIEKDYEKMELLRAKAGNFLKERLKLELNPKLNKILKVRHGLKFLGVVLWASGRVLNKRSLGRSIANLNHANVAGYRGLVLKHGSRRKIKEFSWRIHERLLSEF